MKVIMLKLLQEKLSSGQKRILKTIWAKIVTIGIFLNIIPETTHLLMDVAHCNLRCSMCPRGGISSLKNPDKGLMSFDLFKKIVRKYMEENVMVTGIVIGNWGGAFVKS